MVSNQREFCFLRVLKWCIGEQVSCWEWVWSEHDGLCGVEPNTQFFVRQVVLSNLMFLFYPIWDQKRGRTDSKRMRSDFKLKIQKNIESWFYRKKVLLFARFSRFFFHENFIWREKNSFSSIRTLVYPSIQDGAVHSFGPRPLLYRCPPFQRIHPFLAFVDYQFQNALKANNNFVSDCDWGITNALNVYLNNRELYQLVCVDNRMIAFEKLNFYCPFFLDSLFDGAEVEVSGDSHQ